MVRRRKDAPQDALRGTHAGFLTMHTLFILSFVAIALGGSLLLGSLFLDFSKSSSSKDRVVDLTVPVSDRRVERRVAVYEFSEFDSETSV